ncbi:DEAD-box ATP-dependent RNA helicase 25 [Tetrabaena socialis]|uniref:ATP-dependent RNA helicase n=1 Tax=Tetrabaena socialis TaxID=47790 RepID=A0A2J8A8S3_9CHLO|nr:DEAD-box ATP-dependent RNA helicase 25 [Tetrabaena socialis]|eukprot:PNH08863.1 DEAD-box ATP-dependent RNA helicase 25 [Tetrabaena socialis]
MAGRGPSGPGPRGPQQQAQQRMPARAPPPMDDGGASVNSADDDEVDLPLVDSKYLSDKKFAEFVISPNSKRALAEVLKYERCSLVQAASIPICLGPDDVIAKAKTGTGKTLAVSALVLSPTRELARQIQTETHKMLTFHPTLSSMVVYGGVDVKKNIRALNARMPDILIATPGRCWDLMTQSHDRHLTSLLDSVRVLVLDEADNLLDMGFRPQIAKILNGLPPTTQRQTYLFSATFPGDVKSLADVALKRQHSYVDAVGEDQATHQHVEASSLCVPKGDLTVQLYCLLAQHMAEEPDYKDRPDAVSGPPRGRPEQVVATANDYAAALLACPTPPGLLAKTVGKMGLKGVSGLNIVKEAQLGVAPAGYALPPPPAPGQAQGQRGGGRGGQQQPAQQQQQQAPASQQPQQQAAAGGGRRGAANGQAAAPPAGQAQGGRDDRRQSGRAGRAGGPDAQGLVPGMEGWTGGRAPPPRPQAQAPQQAPPQQQQRRAPAAAAAPAVDSSLPPGLAQPQQQAPQRQRNERAAAPAVAAAPAAAAPAAPVTAAAAQQASWNPQTAAASAAPAVRPAPVAESQAPPRPQYQLMYGGNSAAPQQAAAPQLDGMQPQYAQQQQQYQQAAQQMPYAQQPAPQQVSYAQQPDPAAGGMPGVPQTAAAEYAVLAAMLGMPPGYGAMPAGQPQQQPYQQPYQQQQVQQVGAMDPSAALLQNLAALGGMQVAPQVAQGRPQPQQQQGGGQVNGLDQQVRAVRRVLRLARGGERGG